MTALSLSLGAFKITMFIRIYAMICERESRNVTDPFTVAICKNKAIVGWLKVTSYISHSNCTTLMSSSNSYETITTKDVKTTKS